MNAQAYRRLPFRHVANVRDLGGYPTKDGGMTQYGVFYRSGNLHRADADEVKLLHGMGVKTVIDLRYQDERERMPNADLGDGVVTCNISLFADLAPEKLAVNHGEPDTQSLIHMYRQVLDECEDKLVELFNAIAAIDEGASLIHCAVGKDRTGITVMFLLAIAGVDDVDIIADYEVSRTYIADFSDDLTGSHYSNMAQFLAYIREQYGSPVEYLKHIGMTDEQLRHIQARITGITATNR